MYEHRYLATAIDLIIAYHGDTPFHLYVKRFFSVNKKYGSRDRKQIASLCYHYFRLGQSAKKLTVEDAILLGTFLCEHSASTLLESIKPEWNALIQKPLKEKVVMVDKEWKMDEIFPFKDELSPGVDAEKFSASFLVQPDLFLRIRPGKNKRVAGKLSGAAIQWQLISQQCIALPNASKIDTIIDLDGEAVVQDLNSQRALEFVQPYINKHQPLVWDCCAASGGKSILAYDLNPKIVLTVSDKRESILKNLQQRFIKAGIKKYNSFITDLANNQSQLPVEKMDLIICDAPCTGSGTWARTPEQLFYFKKETIKKYAALQKSIAGNAVKIIKPGGHFLYITCSVFKKENEEVVNYLKENSQLNLVKMETLKGYGIKADSLFAALFIAPGS